MTEKFDCKERRVKITSKENLWGLCGLCGLCGDIRLTLEVEADSSCA